MQVQAKNTKAPKMSQYNPRKNKSMIALDPPRGRTSITDEPALLDGELEFDQIIEMKE